MTALSNVRVLDLSRILAGPWATQILADLGAEVLKVERPGSGDDTRSWGPPFVKDEEGRSTGTAAYFCSTNRGKRSVAVDFTTPEGRDVLHRLVARSDVLVENFKVGGLAKYGLDYETLRRVNPRLVYCSVTGFGQDGPYRERAGYDFMIQAMGGLMSVTGEDDSLPGGGPVKVGVALADVMTGLYATIAILAALAARERTGEGQHVDLALLDVQVATLANQAANYLIGGVVPGRMGNAHPNVVPYQRLTTSDGYFVLAVGNDAQYVRFCEAAGAPELARDERYRTNADRVAHREELMERIAEIVARRSTAWWLETLEKASVPCGPINDVAQVFDDPQVRHRGLRLELPHPEAGRVPLVASPIRLSQTPVRYGPAPPRLGEHTLEVLGELGGLEAPELERLRASGVIEQSEAPKA